MERKEIYAGDIESCNCVYNWEDFGLQNLGFKGRTEYLTGGLRINRR